MESGVRAWVEAAVAAHSAGTTHPYSEERGQFASRPCEGANLLPSFRFDYLGGRGYENGYGNDLEMKIMIFSINMDKFTGFFDKFLKFYTPASYFNSKSYLANLSAAHSDMAAKKVFRRPRICPQVPAFASAVEGGRAPVPGALVLPAKPLRGATRAQQRVLRPCGFPRKTR